MVNLMKKQIQIDFYRDKISKKTPIKAIIRVISGHLKNNTH